MKKLLVFAALLCVASVASADLVWTVTEVTGPEHTSRGLRAFDVATVGTVAGVDEFTAVDGALTGDLSQAWITFGGPFFETPTLGAPWSYIGGPATVPLAFSLDTHLEFDMDAVVIAKVPSEDFGTTIPTGVMVDGLGLGLSTRMAFDATTNFAFAVDSVIQKLVTPFAHVVVPADSNAHLSAIAVASGGVGTPIEHDFIPEPATLGLLAIGGIGALIRRRRR